MPRKSSRVIVAAKVGRALAAKGYRFRIDASAIARVPLGRYAGHCPRWILPVREWRGSRWVRVGEVLGFDPLNACAADNAWISLLTVAGRAAQWEAYAVPVKRAEGVRHGP